MATPESRDTDTWPMSLVEAAMVAEAAVVAAAAAAAELVLAAGLAAGLEAVAVVEVADLPADRIGGLPVAVVEVVAAAKVEVVAPMSSRSTILVFTAKMI